VRGLGGVALAAVLSCGGPGFQDGDFRCGPAGECPPGFGCLEGACRRGVVDVDPDGGGDGGPRSDAFAGPVIYGHDPSALYRLDPLTLEVTTIGPFRYPPGVSEEIVLDLALSRSGALVAVSLSGLYEVDPATAACTRVGGPLPAQMSGLAYVPEGGGEVLMGAARGGSLYRFDAAYTATAVGPLGRGGCDGDIVWHGESSELLGTLYVDPFTATELARIDPTNGQTTILGSTGTMEVGGLASVDAALYAFSARLEILELDVSTGAILRRIPTPAIAWSGAAAP